MREQEGVTPEEEGVLGTAQRDHGAEQGPAEGTARGEASERSPWACIGCGREVQPWEAVIISINERGRICPKCYRKGVR